MVTQEELKNMSPEQVAEMQKQNCIFCQIVSGKVPSKKVFEDEKVIAFLDINPASSGHILLIPKTHYSILPQIPEDEVGHLFTVAKNLSNALLKGLQVKGTNIFVANGAVAGQKAPHFIIHIIPRKEGDGLNFVLQEIDISKNQIDDIKQKLMPKIREMLGFSVDVSDLVEEKSKQDELESKQPPLEPKLNQENEQNADEQDSANKSEQSSKSKNDDKIDIDAIGQLFK